MTCNKGDKLFYRFSAESQHGCYESTFGPGCSDNNKKIFDKIFDSQIKKV